VLGLEITQQALFYGVVFGLVYAVFAAGFVLVYRATGVLNFAQGEIGAMGAALFALFHVQYGVPYWLAFGGRDHRVCTRGHDHRVVRGATPVRQPAPRAP